MLVVGGIKPLSSLFCPPAPRPSSRRLRPGPPEVRPTSTANCMSTFAAVCFRLSRAESVPLQWDRPLRPQLHCCVPTPGAGSHEISAENGPSRLEVRRKVVRGLLRRSRCCGPRGLVWSRQARGCQNRFPIFIELQALSAHFRQELRCRARGQAGGRAGFLNPDFSIDFRTLAR